MKKLAIIGCGNMGAAIIHSTLNQKVFQAEELLIVEKTPNAHTKKFLAGNIAITAQISEIDRELEMVILAVKPQDSLDALTEIASKINKRTLVISIMAGVSIATIEEKSRASQVIRCMPNTPCSVNLGMTVYCGSPGVDDESFQMADKILSAMGRTIQVDNEGMIDAATAISGSGPAYLFYLAEAMKEGAKALGFNEEQAEILVSQTILGSSVLLNQADEPAQLLRQKVTSPGGTTEAAISFYEDNNLREALVEGFQAAYRRALELSKSS